MALSQNRHGLQGNSLEYLTQVQCFCYRSFTCNTGTKVAIHDKETELLSLGSLNVVLTFLFPFDHSIYLFHAEDPVYLCYTRVKEKWKMEIFSRVGLQQSGWQGEISLMGKLVIDPVFLVTNRNLSSSPPHFLVLLKLASDIVGGITLVEAMPLSILECLLGSGG